MGKDGIEVFFKACKSYLKLVKKYRGISYDTMNAHAAIVFARYMMLSVSVLQGASLLNQSLQMKYEVDFVWVNC